MQKPEKELLNAANEVLECKDCSWNKFCIEPPTMSKEEVDRTIKNAENEGKEDPMSSIMAMLFFGGKERQCNVCPVFANRLKTSEKLVRAIKDIMKNWE